ncbi:putative aspartate-semialdehyde dehydrogenase [Naematelia encephala]|uniref:Aspartate-semialdehyde dehydrogenase n=1 Tax=Naematelia encephala TaxID=71784 RepID=A0A1Y2BGY5_9TREE|nr:putative aspartate-semialdehyde dehydrogenase [Naematelia encephala]
MPNSHPKIKVGVLGATGTVGQRFIQLLATHPYFVIHALGASSRSAGQEYAQVTKWKLATPIPVFVRRMIVQECKPDAEGFSECGVVFSGLDHDVAGDIEFAFRAAELIVFSNAKNYRRDPVVPLMVPLVNPHHLPVVRHQQTTLSPPTKKGYIVTNANCSTTGVVVPLAALEKAFGPLETVMVTTLQAISGAGYPGVSSLDIMDNVVPYIGSEEEKIEWETSKILGGVNDDGKGFDHHAHAPLKISANCNRVPVIDGHTACVSVKFRRETPPSLEDIRKAFADYTCEAQTLGVPSAPPQAIVVHDAPDRPQPRLDRDLHNGACVSVGRIRPCGVLDVKFVCLVDNVRLGAATSSIMNAEIAVERGYIV